MKSLPLTQGRTAIVDSSDYELVSQYKWFAVRGGRGWYASARIGGKTVFLHRFLLNPPARTPIDHINGDGLDNRRSNLRICSWSENSRNKRAKINQANPYKGIKLHGKKWYAYITIAKKKIYAGGHATAVEAARAYDEIARKYFGEFARLNLPPATQ